MKKSVLIIGPGLEIGGVERSLLGLLDAIDYEKFDVDLFLMSHAGDLMSYINKRVNILSERRSLALINEPIKQLFSEGHFMIGSVRLISKIYGDCKAKIKHTQSINTNLCKKIVTLSLKPLDKKYDYALGFFAPHYFLVDKVNADLKIGWVHTDYSSKEEKPDAPFYLPMWRKLNYIACVSDSTKESFCKVYPSLKNKTVTIENILSPSMIYKQSENLITDSFVSDSYISLLSVGRFCVAKAFDLIPEVCSILVSLGYHIRWYLIGFGPDEYLIRKRVREWAMEKHVIILGKKVNPYPYIKACDIYVQPSRYEAKAVTVTEAQILHKPVMITRFTTSSSQVNEGIDGYICEQGVKGIANGVAYLIDHPEVRQTLINGTYIKEYDNSGELEKIWGLLPQKDDSINN